MLLAIETSMFAILIATYFYLRQNFALWPPPVAQLTATLDPLPQLVYGTLNTLLLVLSAHHDLVNFTLPEHAGDGRWRLLIDTHVEGKLDKTAFASGDVYGVTARSLLLFQLT